MSAQLVVIVDETAGSAFVVRAFYYEDDGHRRQLVADTQKVSETTGLDGLAGCIAALSSIR